MKKITSLIVITFMTLIPFTLIGQIDWGDAPDSPYPTLAANNGAHHIIIPGFQMGVFIDGENDGQPMSNAMGDDLNFDDADGAIFNSWLLANQNATVIVSVSVQGMINGWIDFNVDGDWLDTGEQIFMDVFLSPGTNILTFNVPNNIPNGLYTFSRLRFSSKPGLSFTGMAPDGEVEDYMLLLGPSLTTDIMIDPNPCETLIQNEISLAMIPGEMFNPPDLLIAAYNDEPFPGGPGLGISYSTDVGATWNNTHLQYPWNPIGMVPMLDAFDPTITIDDSGHVFVGQISTDANWGAGPVSGLFVHKSIDGGLTWLPPVQVSLNGPATGVPDTAYRFNDRDQIISDNYANSPYYNNVYITWIKDRGWYAAQPWGDIYFSYSTNGGNSFSTPLRINSWSNDMGNMPVPDVAKDGTVYVLWMDYNVISGGQGIMFLDISTDGGVTFSQDIIVDTINLPPLNLNGLTDIRAKGAAVIRVMPSTPNELYIVYAADPDVTDLDEADIFLIKSTDAGNSWSNPIKVNDDATHNDQVLPWMVIKPNGVIDIAWYDRRNDPNDLFWDVYYTYSTDGGNSFAPNVQVNSQSFASPTPTKVSDPWMGEYLGIAASYNDAFIIFTSSIPDGIGNVLYTVTPNPELGTDWGDAPDPTYPTMAINLGASHLLDGATFLGVVVDSEPDGIPDPQALGDDNYGPVVDEDGVTFPILWQGNTDTLTVVAGTSGFLNAWIDYNVDGDWADAGEQIFVDQALIAGTNKLLLSIPSGAATVKTFARFRFASYTGLGYTGQANDGEVEDYMIIIQESTNIDVDNFKNGFIVDVFPNPFTTRTSICYTLSIPTIVTLQIFDNEGVKVFDKQSRQLEGYNQIEFYAGDLPAGIYFYHLRAGEQVSEGKVVIINN